MKEKLQLLMTLYELKNNSSIHLELHKDYSGVLINSEDEERIALFDSLEELYIILKK